MKAVLPRLVQVNNMIWIFLLVSKEVHLAEFYRDKWVIFSALCVMPCDMRFLISVWVYFVFVIFIKFVVYYYYYFARQLSFRWKSRVHKFNFNLIVGYVSNCTFPLLQFQFPNTVPLQISSKSWFILNYDLLFTYIKVGEVEFRVSNRKDNIERMCLSHSQHFIIVILF